VPVVTSDILALTVAGLKTEFDQAYLLRQQTAEWKYIATEIPTTLPIQNYGFLGRGAVMEQFKDRAREQEVNEFTYNLADNTYNANLVIDRKAIEDDQYGLLMMRVRMLGEEPVRHWNELAYNGLPLGFTTNGYDGSTFFSTSHQEGLSPTQSNKGVAVLSDAALQTAEAAMMAYVDDKGKPHEIVPDTLVVGPSNARLATDLTGSEIIVQMPGAGTAGTGATAYTPYNNYFKGRYRVVVSPYLIGSAAANWFLIDTKKVIKPIIIQSRSDVPIVVETDMLDGHARIREKYSFRARGRYVQGFGLWQTAYGSTGAGS